MPLESICELNVVRSAKRNGPRDINLGVFAEDNACRIDEPETCAWDTRTHGSINICHFPTRDPGNDVADRVFTGKQGGFATINRESAEAVKQVASIREATFLRNREDPAVEIDRSRHSPRKCPVNRHLPRCRLAGTQGCKDRESQSVVLYVSHVELPCERLQPVANQEIGSPEAGMAVFRGLQQVQLGGAQATCCSQVAGLQVGVEIGHQ